MKVSPEGLEFMVEEEGFKLKPYKDIKGVWTIGIGCTRWEDGTPVKSTDKPISKERVISLFHSRLSLYEQGVLKKIKSNINQNQFDALVSLCFNIGISAFQKSTVAKLVNENPNNPKISDAFKMWKKSGNKPNALLNRRIRESELYFKK